MGRWGWVTAAIIVALWLAVAAWIVAVVMRVLA